MPVNLSNRSFLKELDFTPDEWRLLLTVAAELKTAKRLGAETPRLLGRNIALIFEKTSTRTRCAFEVAAHDQGAHVTFLDSASSQLGHKESIEDTARVLGRFYDAIEYRGFAQQHVETLARYAGVPVWNGLTDEWHPTQALCDMLTMREHCTKHDADIAFAFCGDARNNMGNSLLITAAMMGMDVRMAAPKARWNEPEVVERAQRIAKTTGARLTQTDDIADAVRGVDFLYTDVWLSMGEPRERWPQRVEELRPYQINMDVIRLTKNPAVKVMHCLPAFHDRRTKIGEDIYQQTGLEALEITGEVFDSPHSIVFDQAENRMHTIKAIMVATLGG
jgi:ornithine carbamoyltransferase